MNRLLLFSFVSLRVLTTVAVYRFPESPINVTLNPVKCETSELKTTYKYAEGILIYFNLTGILVIKEAFNESKVL